ncbi:MAG: esterase/lipase family protein [Solirubrobacteraceae bacterium]
MSATPPAPAWWGRHLAETRWILEAVRLSVDPVFIGLGGSVPHGDGRTVVLLPGFLAGDQTLAALAAWLLRIGYSARTCGFVVNVDCSERTLDRLERRVEALHERSGRRVALIGHSRGGHYARALAARRPELVSHAISLGADLRSLLEISLPTRAAIAAAAVVLRRTGRTRHKDCLTIDCPCPFAADYRRAFPTAAVRLTSIYSKGDGVVRWQQQVVPEADCVEVTGSHVGLVFNRKVYRAIAAALADPELPAPASSSRKLSIAAITSSV